MIAGFGNTFIFSSPCISPVLEVGSSSPSLLSDGCTIQSIILLESYNSKQRRQCTLSYKDQALGTRDFIQRILGRRTMLPGHCQTWRKLMSTFEFSAIVDGKLYEGRFMVTRENITVSSEYGSKTTQVGKTPAKTLARIILAEIVRDELRNRGSLTRPKAPPAPHSPP